jgi:hypothetical protein
MSNETADPTTFPDDPNSPDEEPDSPALVQVAKLTKKIWDLPPDARPNHRPDAPPQAAAQEKEEEKEDLIMLPDQERLCRHPDREEIEQEFVNWRDVWYLAKDYKIGDYRCIYRHAAATGLIERRRANVRRVLDSILEKAPGTVTADSVIRAIRAYSCLTNDNRWVEPTSRVEFSVAKPVPPVRLAPQQPPPPPCPTDDTNLNVPPAARDNILIMETGLEIGPTR